MARKSKSRSRSPSKNRKSKSRSRSPPKSRKSKSRSRSRSTTSHGSKTLKYLSSQQMDVAPFITPKSRVQDLSAGLFANSYKPLFTDESRYVSKGRYSPFSPNAKKQDLFSNLTSDNEYMKRLLDLHREGEQINLSTNGIVGASGSPITIMDKHPNPIITEKQTGGSAALNKIIGGSYMGLVPPIGSNMGYRHVNFTPPKTPQYIKNRIKDLDQMILKADIDDKDTGRMLKNSNYMINNNPDSFDPDKEYLFNYRKY